jgi:hypothetical protein
MTGPNQLYGYDPATGKLYPMVEDGFGHYNLTVIMGGAEVIFELNELIDHPGWKKAWLQYCRLMSASKYVVARDMTSGTEGADARFADPGRLAGYVYVQTKEAAFAGKAWSGVIGGRQRPLTYATTALKGPEVLNPIEEVTGISTNSVSQNCLQTIEVLAMCGDRMPG